MAKKAKGNHNLLDQLLETTPLVKKGLLKIQ